MRDRVDERRWVNIRLGGVIMVGGRNCCRKRGG